MKKTNKLSNAIKSIDKCIDIKEIYNNGIELKDGSFITGIKIKPFDIWTADDVQARNVINSLRYAYNVINFKVYQALVYTPSNFDVMENSLIKELDVANDVQREIIIDDLAKIDSFSSNNKKLEFHLFIKEKDIKKLARNYDVLKTEFGRAFYVEELYYLDYMNYCNWLFDIEDKMISKAFYHGNVLDDSPVPAKKFVSEENIISEYDPTEDKDIKQNKVLYNLYEITENSSEYFTINGKYYCLILAKSLPSEFSVGLFNYLGRNQDIKMMFMSDNCDLDLVTHIKKETRNLEEMYKKATAERNMIQQEELENRIISLRSFSRNMSINRDKTLDVSLAFVVSHYEYKEMLYIKKNFMQALRNMGMTVFAPKYMQFALFKYFSPLFAHDSLLNETQKFNVGFPLSTDSFAKTYPYHFATNEDERGFLYGYERNMKGRILLDPYYYKDFVPQAVQENRLNGNIILMGESGSGKSTDLFLFLRYFIRRNSFIMWIDPENQNKRYTLKNGGTYLEFGSNKFQFNVWQLVRVSSDEEDEEIREQELWNTEMAIINAIDTFKNVLLLYCKHIDDATLNVVGMIAKEMYKSKGITPEAMPSFKSLKNTDYPIMEDFAMALISVRSKFLAQNNTKYVDACEDLLIKITPMLEEHRFMFNGHTTQDIKIRPGQLVGIGTKKLYLKDENVQNALYYIIYTQAFNYCLDASVDSVFMYDEAHTTMKSPLTVSLLDQFTRRSRKYSNICMLGTQEPLDFNKPEMLGIINNSTYIITKMLTKDNALNTLKGMIGVSDEDLEIIKGFSQGDSYFKCGKKAFYMHTLLTSKESMDKGNNY